jgi:hypothetical protein
MKKQLLLAAIAIVSASAIFVACTKGTSTEGSTPTASQQSVSLYLTDGPGLFNNVFLDIRSVEVLVDTAKDTREHDHCDWDSIGDRDDKKPDTASLIWSKLNFKAGIYDVLKLRNGVDTLISKTNIPIGAIRLIKIDLGPNNSIVKDSVSYNLSLLTGTHSYILIKLHGDGDEWEDFNDDRGIAGHRLWLDFDVLRSVIYVDGKYYLAPFLRTFLENKTGKIEGHVSPKAALPVSIKVFNGADTLYALPDHDRDGEFKVRGLKDGTYTMLIHSLRRDSAGIAINPYKDSTISNIVIRNANTVSVGNIVLHN